MEENNELISQLFAMQDLKYREFSLPLMPTVDPKKVIGIRTPVLRKFAKEFSKTDSAKKFLQDLPHYYFEENNLHSYLIEQIKDYGECINRLKEFLPFVDNWATCDCMSPKALLKNRELLFKDIQVFLNSSKTYVIRFGILCAMRAFIGKNYSSFLAEKIAAIKSDEYYVNCAIGWYFATLIAKNESEALEFIEKKALNKTAQNMAIKKARESFRVSNLTKEILLAYKI